MLVCKTTLTINIVYSTSQFIKTGKC